MFCVKCGHEIPDNAMFCSGCGTAVRKPAASAAPTADQTVTTSQAQVNGYTPAPGPAKKINPLIFIIPIVAVLAIISLILFVPGKKNSVDLNDYVTVSFDGYDSKGSATVEFDDSAFIEDYSERIKTEKNVDAETSCRSLIQSLVYNLDKKSDLSNGDIVTLSWTIDADNLDEVYGLKVTASDRTFTVQGLELIARFDAFEGVTVTYDGISPNGSAQIQAPDNELRYELDRSSNIANGDVLVMTVSYGSYSVDEYIEKFGKLAESETKEFTVEGMDEYVASFDDIDAKTLDQMKSEARDVVEQYIEDEFNGNVILDGMEYFGDVFCYIKPEYRNGMDANEAYLFYKGTIKSDGGHFEDTVIYFLVSISDILKTGDKIDYKMSNEPRGKKGFYENLWLKGMNEPMKGFTDPLVAYATFTNWRKYDITGTGECKDYNTAAVLTTLEELEDSALGDINNRALEIVETYTETHWGGNRDTVYGTLENPEILGYSLITGMDFNALYVVVGGDVKEGTLTTNADYIYMPVKFTALFTYDGKVRWVEEESEPEGFCSLFGYNQTRGFIDGNEMYNKIISHTDVYTHEVSEGLEQFAD